MSGSLGSCLFRSPMYPRYRVQCLVAPLASVCLFIWLSFSCDMQGGFFSVSMGFPGGSVGKESACSADMQETQV